MPTQLSRALLGQIITGVLRPHSQDLADSIRSVWHTDTHSIFLNPEAWVRQGRGLTREGYEYVFVCSSLGLTATLGVASDDRTICSVRLIYDPEETLRLRRRLPEFTEPWADWQQKTWSLDVSSREVAAALMTSEDKEVRLMALTILGKASLPTSGAPKDIRLGGLGRPQ